MEITYRPEEGFPVCSAEIEWEDGSPRQQMKFSGGAWSCPVARSTGEFLYRLILDGAFSIVDPECNTVKPDSEGIVWSVLIVDPDGNRQYDADAHGLSIEEYRMTGGENPEVFAGEEERKCFDTGYDMQISVQLILTEITGLHVVTLLWTAPDGSIFDTSEEAVCETEEDMPVKVWFDLELRNTQYDYPYGQWGVKLLIDGSLILEDEFTLVNELMHPMIFMQA